MYFVGPMDIHTARLSLHRVGPGDEGFVLDVFSAPSTRAQISHRIATVDDARAYLERRRTDLLFRVRHAESDIGLVSLISSDPTPCPHIGFVLLEHYWGQGFALEAVTAVLERVARDNLALARVCAITLPANERSLRLLHKLGLRRTGTFSFPPPLGAEQPPVVFELLELDLAGRDKK